MTDDASVTMVPATQVQLGDRLRSRDGSELIVTRIDHGFLGRPEMIAFVEDSERQWFKMPAPADSEVERLEQAASDT
jgi:hypothetical protein